MDGENPFTPGYGQQPPYLAGRADLVDQAIRGLRRGPGSPAYHQFVIGARGTGKTVTIEATVELAVAEHGAVVARWTAGSRPLQEAMAVAAQELRPVLRSRWGRSGGVQASATVGVPGLVSATASTVPAGPPPSGSAFGLIQRLAGDAARRRRQVIVWVDEAHNATREDVVVLAAVMQELANVRRLPVAVWAAGLPEARHRWIDAASPLERQRFTVVGNLGRDDAVAALAIPIREAGGVVDDEVVEQLAAASNGFPYVIQLIGYHAWEAAGDGPLDADAARTGIRRAVDELQPQLFVARWRQLTPALRDYVAAAAEVEDPATGLVSSSAVAQRLGMSTAQVSGRRDLLINTHQLLASPGRDQLVFSQPGLAHWVRSLRHGRAGGPGRASGALTP